MCSKNRAHFQKKIKKTLENPTFFFIFSFFIFNRISSKNEIVAFFFLISIGFSAKIITGKRVQDQRNLTLHNLSCAIIYDVWNHLDTSAAQGQEVCLKNYLQNDLYLQFLKFKVCIHLYTSIFKYLHKK